MNPPLWIDEAALTYPDAMAALEDFLQGPPRSTVPRQIIDTTSGQLLLMPAEIPPYAGVKVVTIAPANPTVGLPRINGIYLLFDSTTLVVLAQFDAAWLTAVRTAAVSALAVDRLAPPEAHRLALFGAGPQAHSHLDAIAAIRPLRVVHVVARTNADAVVAHARRLDLDARLAGPDAVAGSDLVACCTTAREPLFDSAQLPGHATVVAVGSHEPEARELDAGLMRRATVVVESRASAATAGDIVLAGGIELVSGELADLVAGRIPVENDRPRVFKSVGEAWEDLVIAAATYRQPSGSNPGRQLRPGS